MSKRILSILAAGLALSFAGQAAANSKCGGLNQRVCKKWEQIRGCDPGLHRTSPIGGTCTYDNKFIPDPIEKIIAPAPTPDPAPEPEPPVVEAPPPDNPGYYIPPAPPKKKGSLPHLSTMPPTQPTAMDGLWKLDFFSLPFKLEAGRLYSMSEYMHLFIFPVEPFDVVVKDIVQVGPGHLSGYDMVAPGPWTVRLQPDGTLALRVDGLLGPFESKFTAVSLTDPQWFAQELASLSGGYQPPPSQIPGSSGGFPQPPAPVPPADDGSAQYPPGWGN